MPTPHPTSRPPRSPYELANELPGQIDSGVLAPGDQLPTVVELASRFGVSAGTVNRAVAVLKSEGLVDVSLKRAGRLPIRQAPSSAVIHCLKRYLASEVFTALRTDHQS